MTTEPTTTAYLIFRRNRARFAIDAAFVREVIHLPELGPIVSQKPGMVGLISLRGVAVPVMDLDLRQGRAPALPYRVTDRLILLDFGGALTGLIVSEVLDMVPLDSSAFAQTNEAGPCAIGITHWGDGLVALLDIERLLSAPVSDPPAHRNGHRKHPNTEVPSIAPVLPDNLCDPDPDAQAIFRERARELAHQDHLSESASAKSMTLAIVGLNTERIGIPVSNVREFGTVRGVTPVPSGPEHVRGLMNLRGELLTLIDIRSALHLSPAEADKGQMTVVAQSDEMRFGIVVDRVIDVITVSATDVHGVGTTAPSRLNGFVQGTVRYDDALLSILDLDRILREGELIIDDAAA